MTARHRFRWDPYGWIVSAVTLWAAWLIMGNAMMDRADADQPVPAALGPVWAALGLAAGVCLTVFLVKISRRPRGTTPG